MKEPSNVRWLASRLSVYWMPIVVGLLCAIVSGLVSTLDPLLMRSLIDQALPRHDLKGAQSLALGIGVCYLARSAMFGIVNLINLSVAQGFVRDLRGELLDQMNRLSPDYHERTPVGEKMTCVEHDVDQIADLGADSVNQSIRAVLLFVLNLAMMAHLSVAMTLVLLPLLPLFAVIQRIFYRLIGRRSDQARSHLGVASGVLNEHLAAVPQIQLLGAEALSAQKSARAWSAMLQAKWVERCAQVGYSVSVGAIISTAIAVVLCYGGERVGEGTLTIGGLVAFYSFVTRVFEPVSLATDLYARMQSIGSNMRRVREFLEVKCGVPDTGQLNGLGLALEQGLDINGVHFSYNGKPVVSDVSFRIRAGEHVAMVGPSGSGKSTLARLLVRLADPAAGEILLEKDGLSQYRLSGLRKAICYVPQYPLLFDGTVRENLLYGNPSANIDEINRALHVACFEPVIATLQLGLDTPLGPGAIGLSGGERQRLAVARSLLRNSSILILDESTSCLDALTEKVLLRNIARLYLGRTLLIISHRISSLTWVDRFLVVENGKLVGDGVHSTLYENCSSYRKSFDLSVQKAAEHSNDGSGSANTTLQHLHHVSGSQ